jgi:hypothetical protein
MRERSHKKGEVYLRDVKHWLTRGHFRGFEVELFGDAYDVTKKACTIGDVVFDFSLKLYRGDVTRHILYGECKYRNERQGNVNQDFHDFLKRVYNALKSAEADDFDSALFVFISTIPSDGWRTYLGNKHRYCSDNIAWGPNVKRVDEVLQKLIQVVHVLVLSADIVARE